MNRSSARLRSLVAVPGQQLEIAVDIVDTGQRHAPLDPALQRSGLVEREIMRSLIAQQIDDLLEAVARKRRRAALAAPDIAVTAIPGERLRHLRHREDEIDGAGRDGGTRHPVKLRVLRFLGDHQAARLLDRPSPGAAVIAGARENDADGALTERAARDRSRESNGIRTPWRSSGGDSRSVPVVHREKAPGRNDADVVWLEPHALARFNDRQRGMGGQQLDQHAGMGGIEMLDQDESHAAVGGKRREERAKRLQPAGGCADRDHREIDFTSLRARLFAAPVAAGRAASPRAVLTGAPS